MPNRSVRLARRFFITLPLALATAAFACGCGGGGGGSPASTFVAPVPTPTPTPTPPPSGPLALSLNSATFTLSGSTAVVSVSEPGYGDAIAADASACGNIASISPLSATAPASFTITAQGSGSCSIAFTDRFGQRAAVAVGVTITKAGIQ
jgi:hypothetical protein